MQDFSRLYYPGVDYKNIVYITQGHGVYTYGILLCTSRLLLRIIAQLQFHYYRISLLCFHHIITSISYLSTFHFLPYCWIFHYHLICVSLLISEVKCFSFLFLAEGVLFCEFSICILILVILLSLPTFLLVYRNYYVFQLLIFF